MHWLIKNAIIFAAAYIVVAGLLYSIQRKFIYFPYDSNLTLEQVSIKNIESVVVNISEELALTSWYIPAQGKETIVWFHGNAINYKDSLSLARPYLDQGYGVLLAEYPGYGGNPGKPTEESLYQSARVYIDWLLDDKNIPEDQIILYGQSIGSGVAIQMALENQNIRALVLEAPFTSAVHIAQKSFFFLPVGLLLKDRFENDLKIQKIKSPVLFVHGAKDDMIPPYHSKTLFDLSPSENKERIVIEEAGHNNLSAHGINTIVITALKEMFE